MSFLLAEAPVEIGNRVWYDADLDGIQDPDEAAINGAPVQLWTVDGSGNPVTQLRLDDNGDDQRPGGHLLLPHGRRDVGRHDGLPQGRQLCRRVPAAGERFADARLAREHADGVHRTHLGAHDPHDADRRVRTL